MTSGGGGVEETGVFNLPFWPVFSPKNGESLYILARM